MANPALRLMGSGVGFRAAPPARGFTLRSVWRALMRRKLLLLAPVALITLGAFFWAVQKPPMYTAEALLHAGEDPPRPQDRRAD